jgi:cytochrome bd-type quinol oxidase subunit 2
LLDAIRRGQSASSCSGPAASLTASSVHYPDKLTVWQTAATPMSPMIMFVGALVLPMTAACSAFAYRNFWGEVTDLRYA